MPTPTWLAATAGSAGKAGQVNQFLGTHAVTWVYTGTSVAAQTTLGSGKVNTNSLWLAQSFSTGVSTTAAGRVLLYLGYTGSPNPVTIGLYADSSGPTGSALVTTAVPKEFVTAGGAALSIPLPVAVSGSTTYWIVAQADGDASDYFSWYKSNQVTGASTSPDGVTWTSQAYGFDFQVFDQAVTNGDLMHTWEDSGARWTALTENASSQISTISEYTAGQTTAGYTVSTRTLSYSTGTLTGVA